MSKKTKTPKKSVAKNGVAKKTQHWSLGVFKSSANGGDPVVCYCKRDGTVAPYLAKRVTTKKASARGVFTDMSYAEARAQLLKEAGIKEKARAKK